MAERAKESAVRPPFPRSRTFGTTAVSAGRQFSWLWSRESLLRLGLSFVLAVALWLYVTSKENPTVIDYGQPLPVGISNIGQGLTVTNALGDVHVRIRVGSGSQIITTANFHPVINLFGKRPGSYPHVKVTVLTDPGIHVVSVAPAYVPVTIERQLTKRVQVLAHVISPAPRGYEMLTPRFDPSSIAVQGPTSLVSQVSQASVDINLSGIRSGLQGPQRPLLLDSQGVPVSGAARLLVTPPEVDVSVPVRQLASFKTVPVLVPIRGQPKAGFGVSGVTVQPSEITATGSPAVLSRLQNVYTASVSVARRGQGSLTVRTSVALPRGVGTITRKVSVQIQLAPVEASSSIQVGISPVGVAPGLVPRVTPAYVLVTVVGPSSKLARAGKSMRAVVDLTGYAAGTYYLTPHIVPPSGLSVGGVYPQSVAVTLQPPTTR